MSRDRGKRPSGAKRKTPDRSGDPQSIYQQPPISSRKRAVSDGRAMIRVRKLENDDLATIGVCPACWNIKERRRDLLIQLKKMGLAVVHKEDLFEGIYRLGRIHAPRCRYSHIQPDPWKRFKSALDC